MVTRLLALVLALIAAPLPAAEVAGVKLAEAEGALVLNGAGLRKRAFFQVYVIGLYVPEKKTAAADLINAGGAKRVVIHMLRDVGADQFTDALMDGMRDNHGEAEMKALEPRAKQLAAIMAEMKEAKKGMRIVLDWQPAAGTRVVVEGKPAGAPIPGEEFFRALLRIWLGERPVQDDLKAALLGGKP